MATSNGRHGFTLLELIIVLAIITTVLAVAWPMLRRPLQRSGTLSAARQLAEHVAFARLTAIERGETLALRFEPNGYRYRIEAAEPATEAEDEGLLEPFAADQDEQRETEPLAELDLESDSDRSEFSPSSDGLATDLDVDRPLPPFEPFEYELPYDVTFTDPAASTADEGLGDDFVRQMDPTEQVGDELPGTDASEDTTLEKLAKADEESSGADWSTAVLFYPTGRTENMQWRLAGRDGYWITVTLRGMLGAVSIGPLEHPVRTGTGAGPGAGRSEPVEWSDTPLNAAPFEPEGPRP